MNPLKHACLFFLFSSILLHTSAQSNTTVVLVSASHPQPGTFVDMMYTPSQEIAAENSTPKITVYYMVSGNNFPVENQVSMLKKGVQWQFTLNVPVIAQAFFIKIENKDVLDNNKGAGYFFELYRNGQPVEGALARIGFLYASGFGWAGIENNDDKAFSYLKKEAQLHPSYLKSQFTYLYAKYLYNSKEETDKKQSVVFVNELLATGKEDDYYTVIGIYNGVGKKVLSDSLKAVFLHRFPGNTYEFEVYRDSLLRMKDPVAMEPLYYTIVEKFKRVKTNSLQSFDLCAHAIAKAYAKSGKMDKVAEFANKMELDLTKPDMYCSLADVIIATGDTAAAMQYLDKSLEGSLVFRRERRYEEGAAFAGSMTPIVCGKYAGILYAQKQYVSALKYIAMVYDSTDKASRYRYCGLYADILTETGNKKEALAKLEELLNATAITPARQEKLKKLFYEVKGPDQDFDAYLLAKANEWKKKMLAELPKQMINVFAPAFVLKDPAGNTVSLAALKGKVVVLDFWATWCVPCKKSFPVMKKAADSYKNSDDVVFLFIHTYEQNGKAPEEAQKYIDDNKLGFHVLMDMKQPETGVNVVAKDFKVSSIPTKFIVDKKGVIRFRIQASSQSDDAIIEEMTAMIEMARKS
jgi:thiol-disulfide isomerase/thioredoxin